MPICLKIRPTLAQAQDLRHELVVPIRFIPSPEKLHLKTGFDATFVTQVYNLKAGHWLVLISSQYGNVGSHTCSFLVILEL